MIAAAGYARFLSGEREDSSLDADPGLSLA